jgi:hypothetical protein
MPRPNDGGGIWNGSRTTATVTGGTLSGNSASNDGGGIWNDGTLTVSQSTLSGNSAGSKGGGIFNSKSGTLTLRSSVVLNNLAPLGADLCNLGHFKLYTSTIGVIAP